MSNDTRPKCRSITIFRKKQVSFILTHTIHAQPRSDTAKTLIEWVQTSSKKAILAPSLTSNIVQNGPFKKLTTIFLTKPPNVLCYFYYKISLKKCRGRTGFDVFMIVESACRAFVECSLIKQQK